MTASARKGGLGARWTKRLCLVFAGAVVAVVISELLFRSFVRSEVYYHGGENLLYLPEFGFGHTPDAVVKDSDEFGDYSYLRNELGFRGPAPPTRPGERESIVFLGDSFLNGHVVRDERLATTVTRDLLRRGSEDVEVYNLATSGIGTAQQLLLFRKYAEPIEPRAVVVVMYPHNDVANNGLSLAGHTTTGPGDYLRPYLIEDGEGRLRRKYLHPFRSWIRARSFAFRSLERTALVSAALEGRSWPSLYPHVTRLRPEERIEAGMALWGLDGVFREPEPGGPWEEAWLATESVLRAFRDEVEATGSRFLVIVVPARCQVERFGPGIGWSSQYRSLGVEIDEYLDWNAPERRLSSFFEREGIDARYLLDSLRESTTPDRSVYAQDAHLNWRGHALIAEETVAWLQGRPSDGEAWSEGVPTGLGASPSWLDFRKEDHSAMLSSHFRKKRTRVDGSELGWMTEHSSELVVGSKREDLILRGTVPGRLQTPVEIHFGQSGGFSRRQVLPEAGPFEMIVPRTHLKPSEDGYTVVSIRCNKTYRPAGQAYQQGVLVHEVGFVDLPQFRGMKLPEDPVELLMSHLDADIDGMLQRVETPVSDDLFERLDGDGNGALDLDELAAVSELGAVH